MSQFFQMLTYYVTHPEAIAYGVGTAIFYPILVIEMIALAYAVFETGRFTVESIKRLMRRRRIDVDAVARAAVGTATAKDPTVVMAFLKANEGSPVARRARQTLGDGSDLSRTRILKAIADAELEASRALEMTRLLIRMGPILGLMTTLIPISPALVALARGDVNVLADKLVVAFSTTVVGLLIGALGYLVTTVRDRYYQQDVVDIEYVFDRMGA